MAEKADSTGEKLFSRFDPYSFTGLEHDESGLVYARNRYYSMPPTDYGYFNFL